MGAVGTAAAVRRSGRLFEVRGSPSSGASHPLWPGGDDGDPCFPEIDCLRGRLPGDVIAAAETRAERLATGADRVLIASGAIDEETYLRALGEACGIAFAPLDDVTRAKCPLDDGQFMQAAAAGLLPLWHKDSLVYVVTPRHLAARTLLAMTKETPGLAARFRFTTTERFNHFTMRCAGKTLAAQASDTLKQQWPALSAASPYRLGNLRTLAPMALALLAALILAPHAIVQAVEILLAAFFIAWLALRITGAMLKRPRVRPAAEPPDQALPVYSIICALYREASSVDGLLSSIERLDYPREKLDVILAVEADDSDTRAAIAARRHRVPVTIIPAPPIGPRTKPKALNVALPFARGAFAVVYDAEDRPDPDQLRCALRAFRNDDRYLACVQARLCIDNTSDSWLAGYFTAEYAGQFDVFLPGLAAMQLPLPLGGSSNHFRTETLRTVGGWDAYNVTEDADLGMRLARFGYRTDMIGSTTYEEAPAKAGPWLRQRTRWFKGWMQTWLVHMRHPVTLLRDLGLPGFLGFQLMVGGNALAALVHPLFMAALVTTLLRGADAHASADAMLAAFYGATAVIGYLSSAIIAFAGLRRRRLKAAAWVLLLTPLHWLMLSLAAWRALYQLIVAPYTWEKTAHGLAKSSHRASKITQGLLDLEREFEAMKTRGELPAIGLSKNTSATPRLTRQACASG